MKRGHQGRVDANQKSIVDALRAEGLSVCSLAGLGNGVPDLLIGANGRTFLAEIKDGEKCPSHRTLTPDQVQWIERWTGSEVRILTDTDQATSWARRIAAADEDVRPARYSVQHYLDVWGRGVA